MSFAKASSLLQAKMGKQIEIVYNEEYPDIIEFIIKNNKGAVKDSLQFNINDVIYALDFIKVTYSIHK